MKNTGKLSLLIQLLFLLIIFYACNRNKVNTPVIVTLAAANITSSTATSGGSIIDDGGANVISSGVCWSTSPNPTVNDSKSSDGSRIGKFFSAATGLSPLTTYHLRSYATNEAGTTYGSEISFQTTDANSIMTDIEGNIYGTKIFGNQVWMKENLKVTRYANGDLIGTTEPPDLALTELLQNISGLTMEMRIWQYVTEDYIPGQQLLTAGNCVQQAGTCLQILNGQS